MNALVGETGFVGTSLMKQTFFEARYRSINIGSIDYKMFDLVVCAAAPAQKWIANRDPEDDLKNIENLISHLGTIQCRKFILVSTVDIFKTSMGVDETTIIDEEDLDPYGLHRRMLEKFVEEHFSKHLIVRLPGLVGPGLRKNIIFDFLNSNNLHMIDSRSVYQFYPMINLWSDIQTALSSQLELVHLTAEPISVADVASQGFNISFDNVLEAVPAAYDFQSKFAELYGSKSCYQYSKSETIQAIRDYAHSEPTFIKAEDKTAK